MITSDNTTDSGRSQRPDDTEQSYDWSNSDDVSRAGLEEDEDDDEDEDDIGYQPLDNDQDGESDRKPLMPVEDLEYDDEDEDDEPGALDPDEYAPGYDRDSAGNLPVSPAAD